jgi:hypothetical protein
MFALSIVFLAHARSFSGRPADLRSSRWISSIATVPRPLLVAALLAGAWQVVSMVGARLRQTGRIGAHAAVTQLVVLGAVTVGEHGHVDY